MTESATPRSGTFPRVEPTRRPLRSLADRVAAGLRNEVSPRAFAAGVAACTGAVATFVALRIHAWPPHEDETLALFVGRGSLASLLEIVLGERGGAPLHFLFAYLVAHLGGGLTALRAVSAVFAIASIPVIAMLVARLSSRTVGLVAAGLASATWALLFHAVYGRMYSLFLVTSALSYLAMLVALDRGGRRSFVLWGLAVVATVATHPYGAIVFGSQIAYVVLARVRARAALWTIAAVAVVCIPFWRTDLVLAGRFDVGVGGGGEKLGSPLRVAKYL
ncbi:MAG: glycosyltransferase family 39 protein, partial [Actinomycetota bacterium]|nr:glycosyltransferase family 39 protein [Actinomycetota bacterium]